MWRFLQTYEEARLQNKLAQVGGGVVWPSGLDAVSARSLFDRHVLTDEEPGASSRQACGGGGGGLVGSPASMQRRPVAVASMGATGASTAPTSGRAATSPATEAARAGSASLALQPAAASTVAASLAQSTLCADRSDSDSVSQSRPQSSQLCRAVRWARESLSLDMARDGLLVGPLPTCNTTSPAPP